MTQEQHYDKNGTDTLTGSSNEYDLSKNEKVCIYKQLHHDIQVELSKHVWEIISYNPLRFLVAHSEYNQIIYANITNKTIKKGFSDGDFEYSETIPKLEYSRIVIGAIPKEIILHKDPLNFTVTKYTIKFLSHSGTPFVIGPKVIDEIISLLKDKSLIYLSTKAAEALATIISSYERNNLLQIKEEVESPGVYFIDGKIRIFNSYHKKPHPIDIKKCINSLELLVTKFKRQDVLATIIKWSMISPFNYIFKQKNKQYIPWIHLYGWSNTGKTTLGDIANCIWDHYHDKNYNLPFTAIDTKARLGESLSKSTYPIIINEIGQLTDDKYKDLLEMVKTSITDTIARKRFINKITYTDIPSYSICILTGNNIPPTDTGYKRRVKTIGFTQQDQYSIEERKEFQKLFESIKVNLKILGNYTVNYIVENPTLLENNDDWNEIAKIILEQLYQSEEKRQCPLWINYIVNDNQLEESKEEMDLLFRSYLITKINETFNKFYNNLTKSEIFDNNSQKKILETGKTNIFADRLEFCLQYKLISFLNTLNDKDDEIIITSDILYEIKNKIPSISSLNEIARIISGFNYGQKKVRSRNIRVAYGKKEQLVEFLET